MFSSLRSFILLLLCSIFLVACSANEEVKKSEEKEEPPAEEVMEQQTDQTDTSDETTLELESPDLPKNLEEVIAYPVGQFSSNDTTLQDEDVQNTLQAIPALTENADEQKLNELFSYLYSLFKKEYQDPKQALSSNTISGPDSGEAQVEETKTFNVEIVLDSSGSMANYMGSQTRMNLAKESIKKFASSLPKEANISLRVYGHKGTGSDDDKIMSCSANELVYSPQSYNQTELDQALNSFEPAGWTPLAQSLIEAQNDLSQYKGENNKNIVYVVSDGIETCGGDPVAAAKSLKDSGVAPVVNIIGFDLTNSDQKQLQEVANAAGGTYTNVKDQGQLQNEFEKAIKESEKWINWKNEQTLDVLTTSNDKKINMMLIADTWKIENSNEKGQLIASLFQLQMMKKITNDQTNKLIKVINSFYNEQMDSVSELRKVLIDASYEDLNATLDQIDQIYNENVSP